MSPPWSRLLELLAPDRRRMGAAALLAALTVAAGVGLMGTSAWLISKAARQPSIAVLQLAIVGVRAFGIGRAVLRYLERLLSHDVTLRLLARVRVAVYRALTPLAPARLVHHRSGDLLGRVVEDVATLEDLYVRVLGPAVAAALVTALALLLMLPFGAGLALVATCGLVTAGTLLPWLAWRLAREPARRMLELRGELGAHLVDGVQGTADLLAFGAEERHRARALALSRAALAEQARQVRASALGGSLATLGADLTVVAVLATAIPAVRSGALDGVYLAVAALVTLAAFEATAALPAAWPGLARAREAAGRLFALIDAAPCVAEPRGASPATPGESGAALLEVRALRFRYPERDRLALDELDLRVERGRRVALVGASGSGKSTLVSLLLRFWEVDEGSIRIRGRDVRAWPTDAVRAEIAWAAQSPHLFSATLRENVRLARPGATDREIRGVLEELGLGPLLASLADGLDTWLGEQAQHLSGGERQRVALARALLREAPLLVLDEPFAHLDPVTERAVLDAIVRAGEGRGTLLATHRLVGLERFDEILVLERGRVVERGPARALARAGGPLASLLARQRSMRVLDDAAFRPETAPGSDAC